MCRIAGMLSLAGILLLASVGTGVAQAWPPWAQEAFGKRIDEPRLQAPQPLPPERPHPSDDVRDGGPRPVIAPITPPEVSFPPDFPANSIVIDTGGRKLFYVLAGQRAYEYAIGVGREGFNWTGTATINRKQAWPDWYPPAEMRARDPRLPQKMTGGIKNPLGAMALYLGDTLYRIHGTNDPKSIGRAESSGCFRMLNSAVLHLASVTEIGTPVAVVGSLPQQPEVSRVPDAAREAGVSNRPKASAPTGATDRPRLVPSATPDYRSLRDYTLSTK